MFKLRDYQEKSVEKGLELFQKKKGSSGINVEPTGSGKSLIIASIGKELEGNTVVFQPNKEILEQNLSKMKAFGVEDVSVFSASLGVKEVSKITFATIGSLYNRKELWDYFDNIIVDECHLVNAKGGMYQEFIEHNGGSMLGLTATPYRLHAYQSMQTGERSVTAKFLTRTRPKMFDDLLNVTQIQKLYADGYLCPIRYTINDNYHHEDIKLNSTGMDFDEKALKEYNEKQDIVGVIMKAIADLSVKHILVFNVFVAEAESLSAQLREKGLRAETVSSDTPPKEREAILAGFKDGSIQVVTNVGVLTTGFDFTALDCVVLARPTQSVALYYQMVGRGIRIHDGKPFVHVIDVCGNVPRFGRIETFEIVAPEKNRKLVRLKSDVSYLTGFDVVNNIDLEKGDYAGYAETEGWSSDIVRFGKYKGQHVAKVPTQYLQWCVETLTFSQMALFKGELKRRNDQPTPPIEANLGLPF